MWLLLMECFPSIYGFVSRSILRQLCSSFSAKRIDILFEKIVTPSIKENKHDFRAQSLDRHTAYEISGPVRTNRFFLKLSTTTHLKQTLIKFLVTSWENDTNNNTAQNL